MPYPAVHGVSKHDGSVLCKGACVLHTCSNDLRKYAATSGGAAAADKSNREQHHLIKVLMNSGGLLAVINSDRSMIHSLPGAWLELPCSSKAYCGGAVASYQVH